MGGVIAAGSAPDAVVLLGPTGAGKTPLGELLERKGFVGRRCAHFDFGAWLRRAAGGEGAAFGLSEAQVARVKQVLAEGALLEDSEFPMALALLRAFEARLDRGADTLLVLNGLPRHAGQARALEGIVNIRLVLVLDAADDVLLERIRSNVGGDRTGRNDDAESAVRARAARYRARTAPLLDYYGSRGVKVIRYAVGPRAKPMDMLAEIERRVREEAGVKA